MEKNNINHIDAAAFDMTLRESGLDPQWRPKLAQMTSYLNKHLAHVVSACWGFYCMGGQCHGILDLLGSNGQTFCITMMVGKENVWPTVFAGGEKQPDTDIGVVDVMEIYNIILFFIQKYQLKEFYIENNFLFFNRGAD